MQQQQMLHSLDDSILENILSFLPAAALASAQLVCRHWSSLIRNAALWRRYACPPTSSAQQQLLQQPTTQQRKKKQKQKRTQQQQQQQQHNSSSAWRTLCLHRAASAKWCQGRLAVSATLTGHCGPITCVDVLHNTVITGSSDGTARVWDLEQGVQAHVLQMHGREAVVAVGLVSVNLAVTATAKGGAVLWRAGAAVARFEPLSVSRVTTIALTDTQLLMGSSSGAVQHFDLFSRQQQLITRHSSGVTCLRTQRQHHVRSSSSSGATQQQAQQQQPQHHPHHQQQQGRHGDVLLLGADAEEEWVILVGCIDGQVSCVSAATGGLLWQLPVRHPSKVVSLQLLEWQPHMCDNSNNNNQQQQQPRQRQPQQQQQQQQQQQRRRLLLYVLNGRSQLICWQLPWGVVQLEPQPLHHTAAGGAASTSAAAAATATRPQNSAAAAAGGGTAQDSTCQRMPLWPLSVCSVAAPASPSQHPPLQAAHNTSTCMLSPLFGRDCLIVGSSLGYLTIVQLQQQREGATGEKASAATATAAGSSKSAAGACDNNSDVAAAAAAAAAAGGGSTEGGAGVDSPAATVVGAISSSPTAGQEPQQEQQTAALPAAATAGGTSSPPSQDNNSSSELLLHVVRHCSLGKLARMLAARQAARIAATQRTAGGGNTSNNRGNSSRRRAGGAGGGNVSRPGSNNSTVTNSSRGAPSTRDADAVEAAAVSAQEHMLDGSKVTCMQFAANGRLLVGLGSGHVCCLKLQHPAASLWGL